MICFVLYPENVFLCEATLGWLQIEFVTRDSLFESIQEERVRERVHWRVPAKRERRGCIQGNGTDQKNHVPFGYLVYLFLSLGTDLICNAPTVHWPIGQTPCNGVRNSSRTGRR